MFFSIATLVEFTSTAETQYSWDRIVNISQKNDFALSPMPHLSWHVSSDYDLAMVKDVLVDVSQSISPFRIKASGLGVFSGIQPVIYFPIVKTRKMLDLHEMLWKKIGKATKSANHFYAPDVWMPHITMAYQNAGSGAISDVIGATINDRIEFEFQVDHFAIIFRDHEELGHKGTFHFAGQVAGVMGDPI